MERNKRWARFTTSSVVVMSTRIFYAAGPGNIAETYRNWKQGLDDPSQVSLTYSGQFFDVCRETGANAFVMSHCTRADEINDPNFRIVHRPKTLRNRGGLLYHLSEVMNGLRVVGAAVRFHADFAIINEGVTHWFVLSLLRLFGIKLIPAIHCVLWPKFRKPGRSQRIINRFNRTVFRNQALAILSASEEIAQQIGEVAGGRPRPVVQFLPTYRQDTFERVAPPTASSPFRVLFAGRIEREKGIFDLLEIARRFDSNHVKGVEFDVCGTGSMLEPLKAEAKRLGLNKNFHCHGYCNRSEMQEMLAKSHVVIVPTTTDFVEGFNQVVVEAVLAGRPVVTSSVCPAISCVRNAVVEVPPDNQRAYGDAILKLFADKKFFDSKQEACAGYKSQFYDRNNGWGAALNEVLRGAETSVNGGSRLEEVKA